MLIDSHCHLDRIDLRPHDHNFANMMAKTRAAGVEHMLCVGISLESYPAMRTLVTTYPQVSVSVGIHPNEPQNQVATQDILVQLAQDPKVVAIGETGLDYYRSNGDLTWQHNRFRTHIKAALGGKKPLIIHSRMADADTMRILQEEGATGVGGVFHCFTGNLATAQAALDLGFYISFSGIITFPNAADLREVAKAIPLDRLLIETDSPYLAPIPHRGKSNEPQYVALVAASLAKLRGISTDALIKATGENFVRLFKPA